MKHPEWPTSCMIFWSVLQGAPMQLHGSNKGAIKCNDGELYMNKVMTWVQAEAQLKYTKKYDYLKGMTSSQWSSSFWVDYCVLTTSRKVFTQGTFYFPHFLWREQHICSRLTSLCCSVRRINSFFSKPVKSTLSERKRITERFSFRVCVLEKYVFKGNAEILCSWFCQKFQNFPILFQTFF